MNEYQKKIKVQQIMHVNDVHRFDGDGGIFFECLCPFERYMNLTTIVSLLCIQLVWQLSQMHQTKAFFSFIESKTIVFSMEIYTPLQLDCARNKTERRMMLLSNGARKQNT